MGNSIISMGVIWKYMKVLFVLFCFLIVTGGILLAFRALRLLNELQFTGKFFITGYPTQNATYSTVKQTKLACTSMDTAEQTLPNNLLYATPLFQLALLSSATSTPHLPSSSSPRELIPATASTKVIYFLTHLILSGVMKKF